MAASQESPMPAVATQPQPALRSIDSCSLDPLNDAPPATWNNRSSERQTECILSHFETKLYNSFISLISVCSTTSCNIQNVLIFKTQTPFS